MNTMTIEQQSNGKAVSEPAAVVILASVTDLLRATAHARAGAALMAIEHLRARCPRPSCGVRLVTTTKCVGFRCDFACAFVGRVAHG